ncbi:hypothetical protein LTR36_007804 [Oleoguttula mirabilis]|uniref:EKC/KEOPS complex subunit BUD32 n=1 Tax=Oleoguttula mirabilis TaxID=1507867 RepID=A0AAV9J9N5_9PEZI|nr:hypothetical protein LTR36_007804 [Oleoguttula mirabilis]
MVHVLPSILRQKRWPESSVRAPDVEGDEPLQEERAPHTDLNCFYPMRIGEVLKSRYQVTAKLGCGGRSTVWLARDLRQWRWKPSEYVAIKVTVTGDVEDKEAGDSELQRLQLILKANKKHPGHDSVRNLLRHFYLTGPGGKHLCLVFEPLRESLGSIKYHWTTRMVTVSLLKVVAGLVLDGLDYLHTECHIIHCDLSESNIIFRFADKSRRETLDLHSQIERTNPLSVKRLRDRTIYMPHDAFGPIVSHLGAAVITDFDVSVSGEDDADRIHDIQPQGYTAPEVMLRAGWSYSTNIWNFGVVLCGLVEGKPLFDDAEREHWRDFSEPLSFARMIAFLGPPPAALLERAERLSEFYDEDGAFRHAELVPEGCSFEAFFTRVEGEDKEVFIGFVRRMLKWAPDERAEANGGECSEEQT